MQFYLTHKLIMILQRLLYLVLFLIWIKTVLFYNLLFFFMYDLFSKVTFFPGRCTQAYRFIGKRGIFTVFVIGYIIYLKNKLATATK